MQRLIVLNGEIFEKAAAYDNVIMIAGFAAFYTTWSGAAEHLERAVVLWSGTLITLSLALYVCWHIYNMVIRQRGQRRFAQAIQTATDPLKFESAWTKAEVAYRKDTTIMLGRWLFVFAPCVVTGLAAAVVLVIGLADAVLSASKTV